MGIKEYDADSVVVKFLRSKRHRQLVLDADEIQLLDFIRRFAKRRLGDPPVLSSSAICHIEATLKREILALGQHKTNDPRHSALELFQLLLFRNRKGIVVVTDLESIDAEGLVFLASLVDTIIETGSEWKVLIAGMQEAIAPFCLHRLGLAENHKSRPEKRVRRQATRKESPRLVTSNGSQWADKLASVLNFKIM